MRAKCTAVVLLVFVVAGAEGPGRADEPDAVKAARLDWFRELVERRPVRFDGEPGRPLVLRTEPVLRWNSPQAGILDGAVFLWLEDDRPRAVVGPFWAPRHGGLYVQFHSLSEQPLVSETDGTAFWSPRAAGVAWKRVADAPPPAATEKARLVQMKAIARGFSASAVKGPPNYDPGSRWQLRLMPQALYRYSSPAAEVSDGALFAFALGTDPELFLLLEAGPDSDSDGGAWRYALAPWCESELRVEYRDSVVWERPHLTGWDPESAYFRTGPTADEPPASDGQR